MAGFGAAKKMQEDREEELPTVSTPTKAKAKNKGPPVPADPKMDIFSLGLVALEMLRKTPLISASSSKEEALRTLGGDGLEAMLREAMEPLPRLQKALLKKMLQISPAERTSAVGLKSSSLLTGNVRGLPAPTKHDAHCSRNPALRIL